MAQRIRNVTANATNSMAANQSTERAGLSLFHPRHAAREAGVHRCGIELDRAAVTGQQPFESIVEQALHRPDLLLPRIPAGAAERVEMPALLAPGEVIAGDKIG